MNVQDEHTRSLWMDITSANAPALSHSQAADVVVIGSGIAGLSVAYELASLGRAVVVLDRGGIGSGMTARSTAHLASALDDTYKELIRVRGEDCARLYYQSVAAAIDRAETILSNEEIDCDFRRVNGYWVLRPIRPNPVSTRNSIAARGWGFRSRTAGTRCRSMPTGWRGRCAFRARHASIPPSILPEWRVRCSVGERCCTLTRALKVSIANMASSS
jgi:FAD dependent oxidoreductase